jgi:dephospho-CoA kinase
MNNLQLIGLSGTNGSGKDTVGHLLAEHHGYLFVSVTDILRDELVSREQPPERAFMRELSAMWRRESGLGVLVDKAMELYKAAPAGTYKGLVVASLRNPGEADEVHKLGGTVVWVDADPHIRYERIQKNAHLRGSVRAVDDKKTLEQFQREEAIEMRRQAGEDEATLDMSSVKERADIYINNNDSDIEGFKKQVESALGL